MRILHILPSLDQNYGGPLRSVLDLSNRARAWGLESEVLGVGEFRVPDNPFPGELIHSVALSRPSFYRYSAEIEAWLQSNLERFDGVVLHGMWLHPGAAGARLCARMGIPYICFPHGMLEPWSVFGQGRWKAIKKVLYWRLRERTIFRGSQAVLYTTERERLLAQKTFVTFNNSHIVVPYGIDLDSMPAEAPKNPALVQPEGCKIALFLSRVHPKKNVGFLIECWAKAGLGRDWRLVIAGPAAPGYAAELHALIRSHGLEQQISMVGPVSGADKSYLFGRASWFVLPSQQENFGIAVLEAVAAGCPVAVSNQVYIADYFHSKAEVLPLDREAWVKFFRERMPDETHRANLVAMDRELTIPRFAINTVSEAWVREINTIFGSHTNDSTVMAVPSQA